MGTALSFVPSCRCSSGVVSLSISAICRPDCTMQSLATSCLRPAVAHGLPVHTRLDAPVSPVAYHSVRVLHACLSPGLLAPSLHSRLIFAGELPSFWSPSLDHCLSGGWLIRPLGRVRFWQDLPCRQVAAYTSFRLSPLHGFRFGEALHPGPARQTTLNHFFSRQESPAAAPAQRGSALPAGPSTSCVFAVINPTAILNKEKQLSALAADVVAVAESSAVLATQQLMSSKLRAWVFAVTGVPPCLAIHMRHPLARLCGAMLQVWPCSRGCPLFSLRSPCRTVPLIPAVSLRPLCAWGPCLSESWWCTASRATVLTVPAAPMTSFPLLAISTIRLPTCQPVRLCGTLATGRPMTSTSPVPAASCRLLAGEAPAMPSPQYLEAAFAQEVPALAAQVEAVSTVDEVGAAFEAWSQAVERSVDAALRRSHSEDPIRHPTPYLGKAFRGRCRPRKVIQRPLTTPLPRRSPLSAAANALAKFGASRHFCAVSARRAWSVAYKLRPSSRSSKVSGGPSAVLLAIPQVSLPDVGFLSDVYQYVQHDCNAVAAMEASDRILCHKHRLQLDLQHGHSAQAYRALRRETLPPFTQSSPVILLRVLPDDSAWVDTRAPALFQLGPATLDDHACQVIEVSSGVLRQSIVATTPDELAQAFAAFWEPLWNRAPRSPLQDLDASALSATNAAPERDPLSVTAMCAVCFATHALMDDTGAQFDSFVDNWAWSGTSVDAMTNSPPLTVSWLSALRLPADVGHHP